MLGWEYPPLVTGGLGPACRGITRGLVQAGAEVLFVVPRAGGSRREGALEVRDLNERLRRASGAPVHAGAAPSSPSPPSSQGPAPQRRSRKLGVLGIDSPLRPYLRPAEYAPERTPTEEPGPGFRGGYGPDLFGEVERYAEVVAEDVRGEAFDIVHAHDWMTFPAAERIAAERGCPLVCHVHASEFDRSAAGPDARIVAIERSGLEAATRVVCVSRYLGERLVEHYDLEAGKLRVVHNAPAHEAPLSPKGARRDGPPTVLFLGRITAQKGPRYFLDAARVVAASDPHVRFVMSGTGDLLPDMIEYAAALGLGQTVHFTGYLSDEEVEEVFAQADVFVLSSVSEPFGLTPLEALARDVPVIVSRQSGVSEVLSSCPKYDHWDTADLADKMRTLLANPALRRQLAKAGQLEVDAMHWDRRADELLTVYGELS